MATEDDQICLPRLDPIENSRRWKSLGYFCHRFHTLQFPGGGQAGQLCRLILRRDQRELRLLSQTERGRQDAEKHN